MILSNKRISKLLRKEFNIPYDSNCLETIIHLVNTIRRDQTIIPATTLPRLNALLKLKLETICDFYALSEEKFRGWLTQFIRIQIGDTLVDENTLILNVVEAYNNVCYMYHEPNNNITQLSEPSSYQSDGSGKLNNARLIYNTYKDVWKSSEFIAYFVKNLDMTILGARTYLYKVRKESNSTL